MMLEGGRQKGDAIDGEETSRGAKIDRVTGRKSKTRVKKGKWNFIYGSCNGKGGGCCGIMNEGSISSGGIIVRREHTKGRSEKL